MTPHAPAAAETLMRHLGLAQRTTAEIQDLYSRPLAPLGAQTAGTGLDRAGSHGNLAVR